MTIRVAVVGATSALGHALVSGLLQESGIQVVLLTRQSSTSAKDFSQYTSQGVELRPVDYTSIPQLTSAFAGVETVINTLFFRDITPIVNLIEASKAAGVKRFAPSEFMFTSKANARLDLFEPKRRIWEKVKQSGLEYTAFQNGIFVDFFALGAPKEYTGYPLKKFGSLVIDIPANKATIPGTGDEPISFSSYRDVGRFVAGAVKLKDRWPEELGMCSETTTYNEIVRHVEAATGKKMEVKYMEKDAIKQMLDNSGGNGMMRFYAQLLDLIADGLGAVPPTLNEKLSKSIAPTENVKGVIAEHWST